MRKFALSQDNVIKLKPKMSFREVVDKYGYPLISKETANNIEYARKALKDGNEKMYHRYVDGTRIGKRDGKEYKFSALSKLGFSILESDIKASSRCCYIMKKSPCRKYEKDTGRKPITGIMADESTVRKQNWLAYGCNIFEGNHPRSNPMSFWTEQDVLQYIVIYNLPYASVYGKSNRTKMVIIIRQGVRERDVTLVCSEFIKKVSQIDFSYYIRRIQKYGNFA